MTAGGVALVLIIILVLVDRLYCKNKPIRKKLIFAVKKTLFWNTIIRAVMVASLKALVGAMLALNKGDSIFDSIWAVTVITSLMLLNVFLTIVIWANLEHLDDKDVIAKIGTLYLDLDVTIRKNRMQPVWPLPFFFLRRIVYTLGIIGFFMGNYLG